ncbi:hypothetical protein IWZ03DRAFT_31724 [Phyllosticta citriasiana]|uniref:Uncharacterized protein n=1 Tax=Phyllosticta citriasiana TaxID=595635 RepID=A0ABR1L2Q2_9PEZI
MIFALPDDHLQSAPRRQHGKTYAGQERKWRVSRRSASMEPSRGAGWLACLAHGSSSSWICCTHCLLAAGRPLFDRHLPSSVYPSYRHAPTVDGGMMQDESRIRASRSRQSRSRCGGHHAVLLRSARLHGLLFFWVDNLPQRTTDQPPAALARLARMCAPTACLLESSSSLAAKTAAGIRRFIPATGKFGRLGFECKPDVRSFLVVAFLATRLVARLKMKGLSSLALFRAWISWRLHVSTLECPAITRCRQDERLTWRQEVIPPLLVSRDES